MKLADLAFLAFDCFVVLCLRLLHGIKLLLQFLYSLKFQRLLVLSVSLACSTRGVGQPLFVFELQAFLFDLFFLALDVGLHFAEAEGTDDKADAWVLQEVLATWPLVLVDVDHVLQHFE